MNGAEAFPAKPPSAATLVEILQQKRSELLTQLRDIEQTIAAMEANPHFEGLFKQVANLVQGRILR
jgi:hypothetical protein